MNQHQEVVALIRGFSIGTTTVWALLALLLLWLAWRAARRCDIRIHKRYMVIIVALAWVSLELWLMSFRYPQLAPLVPEGMEIWVLLPNLLIIIPLVGATLLLLARWRRSGPTELLGHFNIHHRTYGKVFILVWCVGYLGGLLNTLLII
ncbi:MAG: DUF420 domain-containing protein [Gammaproteobacteria bacterium]|nr:DUF420 domain-containing protein [Gammaproteobacteria bacterium]